MKRTINNRIRLAATVFAAVLWSIAFLGNASPAVAQQIQNDLPQNPTSQTGPLGDPIRQLNLSDDQIAKIRAIREQGKDERFALNRRLRQAQVALDEAIEADNASEAVIEQRARELAEAQVAATRMRALTELRIRRVLTPEQITKLRTLKQQALQFRDERRNQRPEQMRPAERLQRRRDALQRGGNLRPGTGPGSQPPLKPRP
jgi:Spy/CpxP family protein refolding chaperone